MLKILLTLFVSISFLNACDSSSNLEQNTNKSKSVLQGKTMGTTYNVVIVHSKELAVDKDKLKSDIDSYLQSFNQQVSTYIPDSQISQFNNSDSTSWIKVDEDFFSIVQAAQNVSKLSAGAFDISISPLVDLWGFGPKKRDDVPNPAQIEAALTQLGYQQLELNPEQQSLRKAQGNLRIDLSAVAKGFAVDKVSELLHKNDFPNHLVEIGGELRASGLNQADQKWRIAIEQPDLTTKITQQGLEITNRAVATSGDYRNYFVEKGQRRSHIIDPKTGYPITHKLASVTVVDDSTALADAYATALLVMGEKEGKVFAKENNLDVLMIIRKDDEDSEKFEFWSSSDFFR